MDLRNIFNGKSVLITGHTGFKGVWLSAFLVHLGARVSGLSLVPSVENTLYQESLIANSLEEEYFEDIRNLNALREALSEKSFDFAFHLAAQSLVLEGFTRPIDTFSINAMGTANLLNVLLEKSNLKTIIVCTTDKVYENFEVTRAFKEDDRLGGVDPYSASKSAAELICRSFAETQNPHSIAVRSARAGNVIGGGDFAKNRLIPDLYRASSQGATLKVRNPNATRPWQHVLDCVHGYLLLSAHAQDSSLLFDSFNFGPTKSLSVSEVIQQFESHNIGTLSIEYANASAQEHKSLSLDSAKAQKLLGWSPVFTPEKAVSQATKWYKKYHVHGADSKDLFSEIQEFQDMKYEM